MSDFGTDLEKAIKAYKTGDLERARRLFINLRKQQSGNSVVNYFLGAVERARGNLEKATEYFNDTLGAEDIKIAVHSALALSQIHSESISPQSARNFLEFFKKDNGYRLDKIGKNRIDLQIARLLRGIDSAEEEKVLKGIIKDTEQNMSDSEELVKLNYKAMRNLSTLYKINWRDEEAIDMCEQIIGRFNPYFEREENPIDISEIIKALAVLYKRNSRLDELNELASKYGEIPGLKELSTNLLDKKSEKSTIETLAEMYFSEIDGEQFGKQLEGIIFPTDGTGDSRNGQRGSTEEGYEKKYSAELSSKKRLEKLRSYKPTGMKRGEDNFEGYFMFEYDQLGIIILEKFFEEKGGTLRESYGSATYILPMDIEIDITANSKTQIKAMRDDDDKKIAALSHTPTYFERLDALIDGIRNNGTDAISEYNERKSKNRQSKTNKNNSPSSQRIGGSAPTTDTASKEIEEAPIENETLTQDNNETAIVENGLLQEEKVEQPSGEDKEEIISRINVLREALEQAKKMEADLTKLIKDLDEQIKKIESEL